MTILGRWRSCQGSLASDAEKITCESSIQKAADDSHTLGICSIRGVVFLSRVVCDGSPGRSAANDPIVVLSASASISISRCWLEALLRLITRCSVVLQ